MKDKNNKAVDMELPGPGFGRRSLAGGALGLIGLIASRTFKRRELDSRVSIKEASHYERIEGDPLNGERT